MTRKRVAVFLPDGVGIRNYLFSDLVRILEEKNADVLIYHNIGANALNEIRQLHDVALEVHDLPTYKESALEKFFRELDCLARLKFFGKLLDNDTIIKNWRPSKRTKLLKFFYFLVELISIFFKTYPAILEIRTWYEARVNKSDYIQSFKIFLQQTKPDIILCTHQRSILASPLFQAAGLLGIKTVTAIYSWDNLPKARMALRAGKYFVWSSYMKDEMALYYPEIPPDDVVITGTPQFEFYRKKKLLLSRGEFREKYGFPGNNPIICYSGGDTLTSPHDQLYLADLAEKLQVIPDGERPRILFRRCPVDWSERFDEVLARFPNDIIPVDPLWTFEKNDKENWALTYPRFDDVVLLVNVAYHCEMVYNVGSTMAHDYSMFGKPACYVNYIPQGADNSYSIDEIYRYQHFRSMPSTGAVVWITSKSDIVDKVMNCLVNHHESLALRKEWVEKVILHPVEKASENIAMELIR